MCKIILDFETSGLNPYHDDIIEIAMKELNTDNIFTCLVRPKSDSLVSDKISQITGITNKMLAKDGIQWEDAYRSANEWLLNLYRSTNNLTIISHNGESFDFIFLRRIFQELKQLDIVHVPVNKIIFIDTLLLAKRLIPGREYYNQYSLCKTHRINSVGNHRALNDVIALEKLFIQFISLLDKLMNKRRSFMDNPHKIHDYCFLRI